jgi:hypothetical protein
VCGCHALPPKVKQALNKTYQESIHKAWDTGCGELQTHWPNWRRIKSRWFYLCLCRSTRLDLTMEVFSIIPPWSNLAITGLIATSHGALGLGFGDVMWSENVTYELCLCSVWSSFSWRFLPPIGLGWSPVGVKVPGIQITPTEARTPPSTVLTHLSDTHVWSIPHTRAIYLHHAHGPYNTINIPRPATRGGKPKNSMYTGYNYSQPNM